MMDQDIKDAFGMFIMANLLALSIPFIFIWCCIDGALKCLKKYL